MLADGLQLERTAIVGHAVALEFIDWCDRVDYSFEFFDWFARPCHGFDDTRRVLLHPYGADVDGTRSGCGNGVASCSGAGMPASSCGYRPAS